MTNPLDFAGKRGTLVGGAMLVLGPILIGCESPAPVSMSAWLACSSVSGDQLVLVHLDFVKNSGRFRLQFFGQDVLYRAQVISHDRKSASGTAVFESSLTGESKATPFKFVYDIDTKKLGVDGASHQCETLQDRSLLSIGAGSSEGSDFQDENRTIND